ncbi:MAG: FHA domain-containing protein, partial [Myxococcota bacterium]|nr:FHA domain-containing protein [Myxococcota bacterium]
MRFCITCGQQLTRAGGGNRIGAIELMRTVVDVQLPDATATDAPPIEPARVIDVVPPERRSDQRLCPRCRGVCEPASQFCRFCGLSLAKAIAQNTTAGASAAPPALDIQVSSARASLVLIARDGTEGRSYALGASTDLGRVEGEILFADDQYVSPRHARIVSRDGEYSVRDLDSTNGIFMRIPFETLTVDEEWDGREDKITMRGHRQAGAPISEPRSEQP